MKVQLRVARNRIAQRFAMALNQLNQRVQHWVDDWRDDLEGDALEISPLAGSTPSQPLASPTLTVSPLYECQNDCHQLQHSEAQQRALISALPDLIMRVTGDGIYLDFLAARNFKVLGGKDLIGTRVEDSLPPALAQLRMTAIQTALQTGELQIYEQEIWIEDTLRTEECRVLAYDEHEVLIIGRDITEQKQAEMELRQREAQLQAIAANIPGYLYRYVVHADGTSTLPYLSAGAEQLFGLPLSAIRTGMENSLSLIYADDRSTVNAAIAAGVQALTPGNIEFRMIDATGALKWLNLIFQVHRTEKGDTVFDGICLDISEKKQLELDRQQAKVTLRENEEKFQTDRQHAEAALRESEARFRQIAETVREGFFVFESASSRYSYVNPAYTAITGIPAELLYQEGTSCWQNHLHPDDRARITERLQQEIQGEMFDEEYRFVQPDGRIRWVRAQMFPLRDDNGVTVRTVGTLQDITDRKQAEAALRLSQERLQTLINALPFGVWVRDADDRVVLQNSVDIARYGDQWGTTLDTFPDIATCDLDYHRIKAEYAIGQFFTHETVENLAGKDHYFLRIVAPLPDQDGQNGMFGVAIDITDLKQTELALQESERLLSMALSAAKAGVWEWNMLTQSAYWSDENFRLLGYEPGQVEPSHDQWLNAIHPEDRERTTAHVAEVLTNLNEMNLEFRVLLPDGTIRWISNIGRIMFDDQNHPISLTGIQIDITDRKCIEAERQQAEIALRQSEERWQLAIEGSNDGIWDHNLITGEHFLSPRCMEILGYDYEEIDSFEKWMDQIHPDDQPVLQTTFQAYLAHKTPIYAVEYRIRCQDGSYKWLLARGKAFWDETGTPLRAIGSMSDITLRKQAETTLQHLNAELEQRVQQRTQDLQQAYARLQDSEARFQTFMNNSPTVSWISKTNGVLVYVSQNYYRTFELQAADAVGQSVFELYPPAIAQPFWHDLQTVIQTHQVLETVRFMPRADGTVGEFLMYKFPLSASSGQPLIGGIAIDITEHRQAEAAIRRSQEQLQLAVEGSGDGLWDWNIPTGETYLSPRWLEMLGYQPGDLPLTIQAWEDLIHPEDYAAVMAVLDAHLRDGSVPYQVEFRARSKPGEWRWILDYGKVVSHTDTGEPLRMVGLQRDITDRKQAEAAIQKSEQDLRTIFNNVYDAILIHALDGTILDANDRALELWGATRSQLLAATIPDLAAPDAPLERLPDILQRVAAGETLRFEWRERRFDDHTCFDVEVSLRKVTLGDRPVIIAGVRDISDRKQAERQLRESQQFIQTVLDTVPLPLFWKNRDSIFLGCNRQLAHIMGLESTAAIVGKTGFEFSPTQAEAEAYRADDQQVMATGVARLGIEETYTLPNGEQRWIETHKAPLRDWAGKVTGVVGMFQDITERKRVEDERKQAEIALRESQQFLQTVIDTFPLVVFWKDRQSVYLGCNSKFAAVSGFASPTEVIGKTDYDMPWAATEAEAYRTDDREVMDSGKAKVGIIETQVQADGSKAWIETNKLPLYNLQGDVIGVLGTYQDITDRKQAEQDLQESRNMLKLVLDTIPQRVFWKDCQSRYLGCNPAFANDYQLTYEAIVGKTDPELPWSQWAERFQNADTRVMSTRVPELNYEEPITNASGDSIWIRSSKIPLTNSQGEVIGVLGYYDDITERKRAEDELRDQEQFLRSIYEGVHQPIFVSDVLPDNRVQVVGWNPVAAALIGKPSEEVTGKPIEAIFPEYEATEILARYAQCIATKQPLTFEESLFLAGETRWMLSTYNPLVNQEGRVYRVVGRAFDITDRKRLEQELRQINAELEHRVEERTLDLQQAMEAAEAANRAKSTFLANMSHELRTPLNAILGFTQLMTRDRNLDDEKRQKLSIINHSGEHLLYLINDILEMSKIEAGRISLTSTSFDLYNLLSILEEMFYLRVREKRLQFKIDRAPTVPRCIETDENKLRQVLINLIGNAVKFTQAGEITVRVAAEQGERGSSTLFFEIADTGIGIASDELESLFEPFIQSGKRHLSQEGTGLGLSISRQFVQLMGGELTVESTPEVGSTFRFSIPVRSTNPCGLFTSLPLRQIISLAPNQPTYRILVVEDNDTNRQLLLQLLQSVGFDVQSATNGQEAIAWWESWHPHLIWMDIRMPILNGYDATQQIRQRERQTSTATPTVIIALTANVFEEERVKALNVGCNDFVRKPFQETDLLQKMADYLGVAYLYADPEPEADSFALPNSFEPIAALRNLAQSWLTQLYEATIELDNTRMTVLIQQIAAEHPMLATFLLQKIDNFDLQQILDLLQQVQPIEEAE